MSVKIDERMYPVNNVTVDQSPIELRQPATRESRNRKQAENDRSVERREDVVARLAKLPGVFLASAMI